jgi:pimeloyl-ACP methyl ester carboxylesterase
VATMLEVIDKGSATAAHPVPLLFVHGGWHAAWCWDENFLGFFADRGYRAVALSLRNHGRSHRTNPLTCSVADLVDDIASVADTLPVEPVIVGHSMGGFIVQKYLETRRAPAGVLVAPMPVSGANRVLLRIVRRHPLRAATGIIAGRSRRAVNTPQAVRANFYSAATPEADIVRYAALLDDELAGKISVEMTWLNLPKPGRVTTPLLVLGAEHDGCFSHKEIHATARAYGTEAVFFPGMGHNMMLEPGWQAVAGEIDGWLTGRGL